MASSSRRLKNSATKKLQSRSFHLSPKKRVIKSGFLQNQYPKKNKKKKKVYSRKKHIIAIYNPNKTISYIKK